MERNNTFDDTDWMFKGACRGKTELFYPPRVTERSEVRSRREALAKKICNSCQVSVECLTYATTHYEQGIWGGLTEDERRKISRRTVAHNQAPLNYGYFGNIALQND